MVRRSGVKPQPIKRKDGTIVWRVRFRLEPGTNPVNETFHDQDEALVFAALVNKAGGAAARKARDAAASGVGTRSIDVAFEDYLAHIGTHAQSGTIDKYRRDWRLRIAPTFGGWPVAAISRGAVESWITDLRDTETIPSKRARAKNPGLQPQYLSPKTIAVAHGLLSAVLKHEVTAERLDTNPAFGVRLPAKQKRREPVFLTESDYAHLVSHVSPEWQDLIHLIAGTGLRWGEATALTPEDFDLDSPQPVVRVSKGWQHAGTGRPWLIGGPKTRAGNRTVSLSAAVVQVIRPRLEDTEPGHLLFEGPSGGRLAGEYFRDAVWRPAIAAAGLPRPPRVHDLRHSHASWLIAQGVPLTFIQRRLGHESIKTTSDTYGHLAPDAFQATAVATARAMALALPEVVGEVTSG